MLKKCDPPAGATNLAQFVRNEAGAELAAIRAAFEPLAKAHGAAAGCPAMEGFAAAVQRFHERARRRLLTGDLVAYGRLPGAWGEYVEIPPHGWRLLIWGDIGDYDGVAGIVKAQRWRPSEPDSWASGWFDRLGFVKLPGGADLDAEIAHAWMVGLELDNVAKGLCPRPRGGGGLRVLGLSFAQPPARLFACRVVEAAAIGPEGACRTWLRTLIAAGPQNLSKSQYRNEAGSRWPALSGRAFDRIWGEATRGARGWGEPGRPKKKT